MSVICYLLFVICYVLMFIKRIYYKQILISLYQYSDIYDKQSLIFLYFNIHSSFHFTSNILTRASAVVGGLLPKLGAKDDPITICGYTVA